MKLSIQRYCPQSPRGAEFVDYEVALEGATLLEALTEIKTKTDATLSFASGCRSSVCGSCAMRVNGTEVLACAYKPKAGDRIEPLRNMPLIRDLIVDAESALAKNVNVMAWAQTRGDGFTVTPADEKINELQSACILCGSCYSACPVFEAKPDFAGPFALTRVWRYVSDVREEEVKEKIDAVQQNGVWDCTLCNECVPVCPQHIAPKQDIVMLRTKSGIFGHMDPAFASGGGFGGGFDLGGSPDFSSPSF